MSNCTMEPSDIPDATATVLYVGNLDKRVTDQMMLNILRTGLQHIKDKILSANMFPPTDMNTLEGYCFVQFEDNNSACQAMTFLNGREFCGKKVKVNWATNSGSTGVPKVIGTSVAIYVGNLDDDITENDLKTAFEVFGEILNIKVVRDPATNRSKNIGFISYTNKTDAEKAIRDMSGQMLKGRPIKTNWATRNQNQKKEELEYDEVYKSTPADNCTVYVGGIPTNASDDLLRGHFEEYGKIFDVRIFAAKNYAFIRFESHAAAATAICKTNGTELNGSCLKCWWGKDGPEGGSSASNFSSNNSNQLSQNNYNPNQTGDPSQYYQNMSPQQLQYLQYYQSWFYHQYQNYNMQQMGGQSNGQQGPGHQGGYNPYQGYQGGQQGGYPQQQQQHQQQGGYPPQNYQN